MVSTHPPTHCGIGAYGEQSVTQLRAQGHLVDIVTPDGQGNVDFAWELRGGSRLLRLFELLPYYSWIVDRFHLSTRAFQLEATGHAPDFGWLEDRLRPLGFHVVLCTRRPDTFAAARRDRLVVSGNPAQYDDLSMFVAEQELLRKLAQASSLPVLELDVSDDDVAGSCDRVADWLASTGGLWAPAT